MFLLERYYPRKCISKNLIYEECKSNDMYRGSLSMRAMDRQLVKLYC